MTRPAADRAQASAATGNRAASADRRRDVAPLSASIETSFVDGLRRADPLPDDAALRGELAAALTRTRAAVGVLAASVDGRPTDQAVAGPVAAYVVYPAPWGPLHIAVDDGGIVSIELRTTTERFVDDLARRLRGIPVPDQPGLPPAWRRLIDRTRLELDEYFAGTRRSFDLPVDLRGVSAWDRLVLGAARDLGFGQVTSYGGLARAIGRPRAARAVGGALGRNPIPLVIPCHRIVAADGSLGGYGGGGHGSQTAMLAVKRALLELEGVSLPARFAR